LALRRIDCWTGAVSAVPEEALGGRRAPSVDCRRVTASRIP